MDEPLSNMDAKLGVQMRTEIRHLVEMLGRETLIGVTTGGDRQFTVLAAADTPVRAGKQVRFGLEPGRLHLFDVTTQQALGIV
jgi:ABC-type sugar transport system ATPase subunit